MFLVWENVCFCGTKKKKNPECQKIVAFIAFEVTEHIYKWRSWSLFFIHPAKVDSVKKIHSVLYWTIVLSLTANGDHI